MSGSHHGAHGHTHGDHAHDHPHEHGHAHGHPHTHEATPVEGGVLGEAVDLTVPDAELSPAALSRRGVLRGAGLLGAGLSAAGAVGAASPAAAVGRAGGDRRGAEYRWLAGDHHIHTQYSPDAMYRVGDQVRAAHQYGLDWMVITDHGGETHARIGVEKTNPDIRAARRSNPDVLVFQGLEWNIPSAEHGTVFVAPGPNEVSVLQQFEQGYDGSVRGASSSSPANEALAVAGLTFLAQQVRDGRTPDALMLANHPARNGVDSPHEIRGWRDAPGRIAIGMEGAPGHQAAGIPVDALGPGSARGYYGNSPSANSFAGYPLESYRTWGGFDWMTSTVGGLWDSLLAEGLPWWVTANSDSHSVYGDWSVNPTGNDRTATGPDGRVFEVDGLYSDPVYGGGVQTGRGDFWPGFYSRTHVGVPRAGYRQVMAAMRDGRVWVDHGGLVDAVDVRVRAVTATSRESTLGGSLRVRQGDDVEVTITVALASGPNWATFRPELARVDLVLGQVTGAVADRDVFTTPSTRVVQSFDTTGVRAQGGTASFTYTVRDVGGPFYVRFRGTDGKRSQVGIYGAAVDPQGPALDVEGDADPWEDLWFYTNPVFVVPEGRPRGRR
ncbi:PHP domain-containing protein [Pseudokineococcus marinus]|uniref:PHP domain-containing protein n=1 Tax=Pseudokineococcus marinus TaxID=351215 RepID=A0A849BPB8_9ACTN|nr:PHP domain-containing protein [Pseudokineococcus marinus]NNH22414.1 PHP domain-containing protein [Pseudokineococcus marinus]